jgi:hypothetical protein
VLHHASHIVFGACGLATITALQLAGLLEVGNSIKPLAAGGARGSGFQEARAGA